MRSFPWWKPLRMAGLFGSDGMRPRRFKSEFASGFFGSLFSGCFNYCAERITKQAGVFAVGVVDPPKFVVFLPCQRLVRVHAGSSAQPEFAKMYQLHKKHAQSFNCPVCGHKESSVGFVGHQPVDFSIALKRPPFSDKVW